MLREWLTELTRTDVLFPNLANRRTWLMVRKDLKRVGIPYRTDEGSADFHTAGRHTHITELMRSGASLPETRELARHSDIRMTMKYTHIGNDNQTKAVSRLPWQSCIGGGRGRVKTNVGSGTRRPNGHLVSPSGIEAKSDDKIPKNINPRLKGGYDAASRDVASSGTEGAPVEAAGIEPASCDPLTRASTCVVR